MILFSQFLYWPNVIVLIAFHLWYCELPPVPFLRRFLLGQINLYLKKLFQTACDDGDVWRVWLLVKIGVDINAKFDSLFRPTALCEAARKGNLEMLRILLQNGADLNAGDINGIEPIQFAMNREHFEACQILIRHGADINRLYNDMEYTAVHGSFLCKSLEFCQWMVDNGADVNVRDKEGATPLFYSMFDQLQDGWGKAQLLIDNGANVNARDDFGKTPLHSASRCGWVYFAEQLLQNGAAINARNNDGDTPLYVAIYSAQWDVVHLLLSEGAIWADLALSTRKWYYAFHEAFVNEQTEVVELMLNQIESLPADNGDGILAKFRTACPIQPLGTVSQRANLTTEKILLHPACEEGHLGVVQLLLKRGANVNPKLSDCCDCTLLHVACEGGHLEIVKLLLSHGANVEAETCEGTTALDIACDEEHLEVVWFLVRQYPWLVVDC